MNYFMEMLNKLFLVARLILSRVNKHCDIFTVNSILLLIISNSVVFAQSGNIKGLVLQEQNQPASYATVALLNPVDSTILISTTAGVDGRFELSRLVARSYVLFISAIGYRPVKIPVTLLVNSMWVTLPPITLNVNNHQLSEVIVKGSAPRLQISGDKLIMNVETSPTLVGINGIELLTKVPGVTVDRSSEQVSLRNQTPLIMIDNRPTYLGPEQLAQLLKTLQSNDIATIEVIQNPSARYESAGAAGIINIRTKKAKKYGALYSGQIGGAYGHFGVQGGTPQHTEGLTFSQRTRYSSIYATVTSGYTQSVRTQQRDQTLLETGQEIGRRTSFYDTHDLLKSQRVMINTDLYLSNRVTLSVQAQQTWSNDNYGQHITQRFWTDTSQTGLVTDYRRYTQQRYSTVGTQLQLKLDTLGRQLTIALDAAKVSTALTSTFDYNAIDTIKPSQPVPSSNILNSPYTNPIYTAKLDYSHPNRLGNYWEAGAKINLTENRNSFASNFVSGNLIQEYFRFQETIYAAYGQWNCNWHKFALQTGLRGENTYAKGYDDNAKLLVDRNYFNIFPSASITTSLGKQQKLTLAYSRRIDRPNYYQFSYFQRFTNRFEYTQGNPLLNPIITNGFSLRHVYKDAIVTSFSFDRASLLYSSYYTVDDKTILGETIIRTSYVNTQPSQVAWYNINNTFPFNINRWIHVDLNAWYTYQVYNNLVNAEEINFTNSSYGGQIASVFTLPKDMLIEISAYANSGYVMGAFERSQPSVQIDFGLRKTFSNQRLAMKVDLNDPFDLNRYKVRITSPQLQAYNQSRWTNRLLKLQLIYTLGNKNSKTSSRATNVQESTNRSLGSPN